MKNVITILVDSVFSECIGKGRTMETSTPFIDQLITEGIFSPNVYSYGPYTDAATKGLYTGQPSLNDYGYYYGLNSSNNNFYKSFSEKGYETYAFYYPCYLIGDRVRQHIDHTVFTSGFDFPAVWMGKYEYYSWKKDNLSNTEITLLIKYTDLLFDCWLFFYNTVSNNAISKSILLDATPTQDSFAKLKEQYSLYNDNKKAYICELLEKGLQHPLASINDFAYGNNVDYQWIRENIYKKYSHFFHELDKKELTLNLRNNSFSFKKILNSKVYAKNTLLCLFAGRFSRYISHKKEWQPVASMQKKIDAVFNILDSRKNDTPFYFSLHTEEPHNYLSYFSYDINNSQLIKEELEYLFPLIEKCGDGFKGNLLYQLSLRYVDLGIKRLYDGLKSRQLLNNTAIVLITDHGSSYTYNPIRESVVNNFYLENYKTPFLIWNSDKQNSANKKYQDEMYSAEDVFSTLCNVFDLSNEIQLKGRNILEENSGRDIVVTEYMGPGCPDMITRDVWMLGKNNHYVVSYKMRIDTDFFDNTPYEIFDISTDPLQKVNLVNRLNYKSNPEIVEIERKVKCRFDQIKVETEKFLSNLESWKSY